ncbi:hypothetical protein J4G43_006635 [Bradyrhizobium barranii subsp. barranii]|uniref:Uncharacterized protein n=1 Tax=Bradyrhizobium barranii subsp. barranii TaxID=2823807 RepID=A0A939M165_9BRAD|nr:hypothetical protein [Bradyrhizobium barranii]UEM13944.1 hypothetical protein J4G43_006635 [Bradyrhizobium barranii subsp. barranii]
MTTSMESVKQSYAKAEAAFAASVRAFETASRKRLSALLALPPQERFDHLTDRSLTSADALALTRSVRAETQPKPRKRISPKTIRPPRRRGLRSLSSPAGVAIVAMAAFYGSVVWFRTPHGIMVTQPVQITLRYPDGRLIDGVMNPGKLWWLIRSHDDRAVIRIWMPTIGYQEFELPASIVQPFEG